MFEGRQYEVRQRVSVRNKYNVYETDEDGDESPILTSAQKAFKLREDFRFSDPETGEELFRVKADSALDIAAAYDVVDSRSDERVGSVRRKATSFVRHTYELLDPDGDTVAVVREDSPLLAMVRRFLTSLVPFSYVVESPSGDHLGEVKGAFSIRDRYSIDLASDELDPRLVVIATVVIDAIEAN